MAILQQAPVDSSKLPKRVYPCDIGAGWQLTAKPNRGKKPPWDRDPSCTRPSGVATSGDAPVGSAHADTRTADEHKMGR